MAVKVKVSFDSQGADQQLKAFQEELGESYKALGEIAKEALQIDKIKDGFEGLKDAAQLLGPLLGDSENKVGGLLDKSFKLGESGAKIGAVFGPLGSIIGGAAGAIGGFFAEALDQSAKIEAAAERAKQKLADEEKQMRELAYAAQDARIETAKMISSLTALDHFSLSSVTTALDKTQDKLDETADKILENLGHADAFIARYQALRAIQEGNIQDAANLLIDALGESANAIDDALDRSAKSTAQLKKDAKDAKDHLGKLQEDLGEIYANRDTFTNEKDVKDAIASYNQVTAAISKYSQIYNESLDEIDRRNKEAKEKKQDQVDAEADFLQALQDAIDDANAEQAKKQQTQNDNLVEMQQQHFLEVAKAEEDAATERAKNQEEIEAERVRKTQELLEQEQEAYRQHVEEIRGYFAPLATVFGQSFDLIAENVAKGTKPFAAYGKAVRSMIADILGSYAKKWGLQALGELAEGFATLGLPVPGARAAAAAHFQAAGLFAAAAAGAGIASIVAGRNTQAPAPASGGGASDSGGASRGNPSLGSRDRGPTQSSGGTILVTFQGNYFLEGEDRTMAKAGHQLARAIGASQRDIRLDTGGP